ncbi:MAG: adenylyltransferase/cytidyltransferase family protein [Bacteroidales bacterium]|nr:adenylyltransferase/cytidyltransferase family protein [Bacteroidales bacterium]MBN2631909.1 adenylyltransferase/cytidyltransferase family protein [Bacteroidales bacterium]
MRIFSGFEKVAEIRNPVVTTGSFDGVHIGHKTILNRLKMLAGNYGGESVLITFHPHPRKILYPDTAGKDLKMINSKEEKFELLRKAGLDNLIVVEFTKDFSKTTSEEFVRDYLHGILRARVVVAGFNHHFGFNKEGDYRQLWGWREKYNFEAEEIPEQEVYNETVSSTKIRKAISEGYIQRANAYLDHYYMIMGVPEDYNAFAAVPFLKVPLTDECKLLPATGIYAVTAVAGEKIAKGMVVINMLPGGDQEVLLHLLEDQPGFKGESIKLLFQKMIHGMVMFDSINVVPELERARADIKELIY